VAGDENDREEAPRASECSLELEPAVAREADVEHEAGGTVRDRLAEERLG
jgi:hypothetical protein